MNNIMKQILVRAGAVLLVFAIVFLPIAYYFCIIDFTFIDRPASWPQNPDYIWEVLFGKDTDKTTTSDPTSPTTDTPPSETSDPTKDPGSTATAGRTDEPFSLDSADALSASGYKVSDLEYVTDGSFRLGILNLAPTAERSLSISKKTVKLLSYEKAREDGLPYAVYTPAEADRLTVEVYMGYMILDTGNGLTVLDASGTPLVSFGYGDFEPAYTRDLAGHALFEKDGSETIEYNGASYEIPAKEYYYIENGGMVRSDYVDLTDNRGLYFDYPVYYGVSDNGIIRVPKTSRNIQMTGDGSLLITDSVIWGYSVTGYYYDKAYSFSSGRAFVQQISPYRGYDDRMLESCYLLAENGAVAYRSLTESYNADGRYLITSMRMPVSLGIENVGSFYFDNGLMLARLVSIDWYTFNFNAMYEKVFSDETVLIDKNGNRFDIPYGYTIKAYSSGMILLEKDGKYGYMDSKGAWIVQPTLGYAEPFYAGLAVVGGDDGSRMMISADGKTVIPSGVFDYISHSSSGIITAHGENGWCAIQVMEKRTDTDNG